MECDEAHSSQRSPVVTVTVGDGEQGGVEYTKVDRESSNDVLTMIVLSAASVCILEHS